MISGRLRYTEAQQAEILDHFIKGGDLTAGGIMHAVTSAAQVQADGDAAWDLENTAPGGPQPRRSQPCNP